MSEIEHDVGLRNRAEAVEQIAGVEGGGDVIALHISHELLGRLGVVPLPGVQGQVAVGECHVDRGGAVRHEADATHRIHEFLTTDGGVDRRRLGE